MESAVDTGFFLKASFLEDVTKFPLIIVLFSKCVKELGSLPVSGVNMEEPFGTLYVSSNSPNKT